VRLVRTPGCQTNALVAHFGELRAGACGHCSGCKNASASPALVSSPGVVTSPGGASPRRALAWDGGGSAGRATLRELSASHPQALGEARQLARFLCGLTSPATSRARLSRHPSFGALAEQRFVEVLAFAESLLDGSA
jgi:ATP-dependent DNA helicase RecQ